MGNRWGFRPDQARGLGGGKLRTVELKNDAQRGVSFYNVRATLQHRVRKVMLLGIYALLAVSLCYE